MTVSGRGPQVPEALRREVEEFLFDEADLLDNWQIEEWFRLFTPDCRYWVPSNENAIDPETETSMIWDDHRNLEDRVARLRSPLVHTQVPRVRTRRVVGNVRVRDVNGDEVKVTSNFVLCEERLQRERVLGGRYQYTLVRQNGGWRIRLKKVELVNNNAALTALTYLL